MRGLYKLLMAFAMFAISTATYAQLSDEERYELMSKVKAEYEMSNIDGTKILNVKNKYVLVDFEIMQSTMKEAYQARAAKIKATRTMGEFLNGAKNKSESTYENRNKFQIGDAVCSAPNGTVSIMSRREIKKYPDRIIGYVSSIPNYAQWGSKNIVINDRIWIKLK